MVRILDTIYFGRLDRPSFFVLASTLSCGFAVMFFALVMTASGGDGMAVLSALGRSGNLLDTPGILLAHGVSEHRTAGVMMLIGLYLIAGLFTLAARARDMGLWGWPTAFVALPVFLLAGLAEAWVATLAMSLGLLIAAWPSRA